MERQQGQRVVVVVAAEVVGPVEDDYEVPLIDVFEQWAAHFGTGAEQRATDTNELYDSFEEGERMPIVSKPDDDDEG